ncbi:MAG: hypothetical protein KJ070_05020, partial [Verrucomicrobia bacterium]|nr:hypothetical protein [Verrucomicrobiota bacterium]
DRYTYYRLLSQLGTDSAPEPPGKIHLNYKNTGGVAVSNFVGWATEEFFTNAANALLSRYSEEWRNANFELYTNTYRTNQPFGLGNIPVRVASNFVYTPSLHRLLQLAANVADSLTNRQNALGADFPSVFQPILRRNGLDDVYVVGYRSVDRISGTSDPQLAQPLDLNNPAQLALVPPMGTAPGANEVNVYGVPWVIGAKKGFPNFNEFAMQTVFEITRKLEIRRPNAAAPQSTWRTNMMYLVSITNVIGVEAWTSYRRNFNLEE